MKPPWSPKVLSMAIQYASIFPLLFPIACEYLESKEERKSFFNHANNTKTVKGSQHVRKKEAYSQRIKGLVSDGSFAILTISQTRIYMGHTISVDDVLEPPPS
jgi:hypothetical protein